MPTFLPDDYALHGSVASEALFGGNVLAPRTSMTGEGSYAEAAENLNVTGLRYPGGSLTEYYFDIDNPDAGTATHAVTGETTNFIPLSEFMDYASAQGEGVTIVLPTRDQLSSETDASGNRYAQIDEESLREFVHDLATGVYGDADISALEIGNEYWGSGEMTAVEYGRVAAEMARIIQDELDLVAETYGLDTSETRILAQMGQNYGYSCLSDDHVDCDPYDVIDELKAAYPDADISYDNIRGNGEVNWSEINNAFIRMGFETEEQQEALDGIVAHVYSKGTESSRHWDLDTIQNTWLSQEEFRDLEIHVTEWNMKSTSGLEREEDYGLHQAHEMLEIMEEFMAAGVDQAHVWPLIQNTSNALATGMEYSGNTVPGEMFSWMSENLPGKVMLDFTPGSDRETEFETGDVDVHAFASQQDMVFYIASNSAESSITELGLSNLFTGYESMEISVLGVAEGANPGSTSSATDVDVRDPSEIYHDGILEIDLDPWEIMQVVIKGMEPTENFAAVLDTLTQEDHAADSYEDIELDDDLSQLLPMLPPESGDEASSSGPADEDHQDDDGGDGGDGGGGWGAIGLAIGLIPLLALLGGGVPGF